MSASRSSREASDGPTSPVLRLEVQRAVAQDGLPGDRQLHAWAAAALRGRRGRAEATLRIVGVDESADYNRRYRGREGPTNVLSFPLEMPQEAGIPYLGDLVLCAPVIEREAREQGKAAAAHWAHMVVHGVLHLLGHDHHEPAEAAEMEALETRLLAGLGFPNPYEEAHSE